MTDKNSSKTEQEMLDQTFGSLDNSITAEGEAAPINSVKKSEKKPMSQNMIVGLATGVALIAGVGYMTVLKPMLNPPQVYGNQNQNETKPMPIQDATQVAQNTNPNLTVNPVEQVKPTVETTVVEQNKTEVNPAAGEFLNKTNEVAVAPVAAASSQVNPVDVATQVQPQAVDVKPVEAQPVKTEVKPVTQTANSTVNAIEDLKNMFDRQNQEFKTVLNGIGDNVSEIKVQVEKQVSINERVEERLTALENGRMNKKTVTGNTVTTNTNVATTVKKTYVKKQVKKSSDDIIDKSKDSDLILDKSLVSSSGEKISVKSNTIVSRVDLPQYPVHSIYSGRVWIKNDDGSLSTYQQGDKLPSGETIKEINSDNFKVTTDKRTL